MVIIGLTGSLGMGKSTAAAYLRSRGIPVFDADAEVHRLYDAEAVPLIEKAFPGTTSASGVDRNRLSEVLTSQPERFAELEAIVHPLVRVSERTFLQEQATAGAPIVVLDIPLLFETGADAMVDATVVVSAPAEVQHERLIGRPDMTSQKLETLLAHQMPDEEKRARADFVVDTSGPIETSRARFDAILAELEARVGTAYEKFWA